MTLGVTQISINGLLPVHQFLLPVCTARVFRRSESSFRRTKQRLRVKPDASFTSAPNSPRQDHIIFNPPSSAPSVYHTPLKFMPLADKRRELLSAISTDSSASRLPPAIRAPHEKQYHLTSEDIAEIRRLRKENPEVWTRAKLAKQFDCSSLFIGIVCEASREHNEKQAKILEDIKSRWGRRRRTAREDRVRRRELWGMDE